MRKLIKIIFCIFLISQLSSCASYDFREVDWGMTKSEVSEKEKEKRSSKPEINNNQLTYIAKTDEGIECELTYLFTDDKLNGAFYIIRKENVYPQSISRIYYYLKDELGKKYGEPFFTDGYSKVTWRGKRTVITLYHSEIDGEELIVTDYRDIKLKSQE